MTLSALFLFFIACIVVLVFIYFRKSNRHDAYSLLTNHFRIMSEDIGKGPDAENEERELREPADNFEVGGDFYSIDRQRKEIYSVISSEELDGEFSVYERATGGNLSDDEIITVANEIFAQSKLSGNYKNYAYASTMIEEQLVISFMDISDVVAREYRNLAALIGLGGIFWGILTLCSIPVSHVLVRPLEESMRRQSEFISMAEHELKTPIAVMKTSLSMLRKEGVESKYLDYADEENEKMKKLVSELLEISRAQRIGVEKPVGFGDIKNSKEFELSECIEGAVLPFESVAYEKGVILENNIEPGIYFKGDETQIDRLVGILLDNAIKHTDKGNKVQIIFKKEDKEKVSLKVCNEGEEIPNEERARIFQPFYRMDKAGGRSEGRFGLGLSIADMIAKAHGTQIFVDYVEGKTVFGFYLKI